MANNIGWGEGAKNNTIGWGQGEQTNGWGSIYNVSPSSDTWIGATRVSAPKGMDISVPFSIIKSNNNYAVSSSFNIQERANITVSKSYYVDSVSGSDSNDGLTESTPKQTLSTFSGISDYDRIYIKRGSVFQKNQRLRQFPRNCIFTVYGTGEQPRITGRVNNQIGSYTATDNYYSASAGDFVAQVVDEANLDVNGNPTNYTQAASVAEVNTTPGSFYWSASVIYIRTIDDRAPDADIICSDSTSALVNTNNLTQLWENITFERSAQFKTADASGVNKQYFYNCNFERGNYQFWGQTECILQNCNLWSYSADVINIDNNPVGLSGAPCNVYEVNCTATNYKNGAGNDQVSTTHNEANVIRIACNYQNSAGQVVADTGVGQSWNMGCTFNDSLNDTTLYASNTTWIEGCVITGDTTSINVDTGGSVYYKNNTLGGSVTETGIYAPYVENPNYLAYLSKISAEGFTAPSTLQQYLGNRLIEEIDSEGVLLDAAFIWAQDGSKDAARVNIYNPSTLGTFNGTITFTSNEGMLGDGSTGYFDTGINPSTASGNYTQNDASLGVWVFTANAGSPTLAGWSIADSSLLMTNSDSGVQRLNTDTDAYTGTPTFAGTGLKLLNRLGASEAYAFDGTTEYPSTATSTALPNANIEVLRRSGAVYGDAEIAFVFFGVNVRSSQAAIKTAIEKYLNQI